MAILDTTYYRAENDEVYSDGSVEGEMLRRASEGDLEVHPGDPWAITYHFSPLRHNILNWYPFRKDCSILEIGAGCGALTGALTRKGGKVVSCELTLLRARINLERHKHEENLTIMVGDFSVLPVFEKFDYVVINGVLEYAAYMIKDQADPYVWMLERAKQFLKPNGKILIAIENRLGLKYFAGAPEDHIGNTFIGIDGYSSDSRIRTFDRNELQSLCNDSGMSISRWFYPYPDYKFPSEIFTDESVNRQEPVSPDEPLDHDRVALFNERKAWKDFARNGVVGCFSNSFLVEVGLDSNTDTKGIDYVKISNDRDKRFAIITELDYSANRVYKIPLYEDGRKHLQEMADYQFRNGNIVTLPYSWDGEKCICDILHSGTLMQKLSDYASRQDMDGFVSILNTMNSSLLMGELSIQEPDPDFEKAFGTLKCNQKLHWQKTECIDLVAGNIFLEKEAWTVIDYEWVFHFPIPAEYILWRTIHQLLFFSEFSDLMKDFDSLAFLGISQETSNVFYEWEVFFQKNYVRIQTLDYRKREKISIEAIRGELTESNNRIRELRDHYEQVDKLKSEKLDQYSAFIEEHCEDIGLILSKGIDLSKWTSFKMVHFINRTKQQCRSDNPEERMAYWKWVRSRARKQHDTDHRYNPLYQLIWPLQKNRDESLAFLSEMKAEIRLIGEESNQRADNNAPAQTDLDTKPRNEADLAGEVNSISPEAIKKVQETELEGEWITDLYQKYDVILPVHEGNPALNERAQEIGKYFTGEGHRVYLLADEGGLPDFEKYEELINKQGVRDALLIIPAGEHRTEYDGLLNKYGFSMIEDDGEQNLEALREKADASFPLVSIIILCYNQLEYTERCIDSIIRNTAYRNYELILVDNCSEDATSLFLSGAARFGKPMRIVLNSENHGFPKGNNEGISLARGKYLILLNNDTIVTRGWITGLKKHFSEGKVGAVGAITNAIGNEAMVTLGYGNDITQMPALAYAYTSAHMGETYPNKGTLAMFCLMISRAAYDEAGPLDEAYGMGMFEDDDFCYSLTRHGYEIVLAEDVFIHHFGSKSFSQIPTEIHLARFNQNKSYFENKWNTVWKDHHFRPGMKPEW